MNKKLKACLIAYPIEAVIAFAVYYLLLPPINWQSKAFWVFVAFIALLAVMPVCFFPSDGGERIIDSIRSVNAALNGKKHITKKTQTKVTARQVIGGIVIAAPIVILIVGSIVSSTVFNARAYAKVITVTESDFSADMPETDKVTNIALMDTDTATIIGSRTLGSLSEVVSQYELSEYYNQINFQRTPQKVSNLEYAGFFKWIGNRDRGIPGYVMVDPVNNTATYKVLEKPLRYVESAYLGDDLMRKLRFDYPTKIFGEARYEVDDEGKPVFIVPCYKPQVLMFGAEDIYQVIVFDPCDGSSELYSVKDTPAWLDGVYDGYLACEKYDWKGLLSGGFWNSIFGNKDCKQTTDDFGYVVIEDDVWYYTGVTSVNSDKSNIGFILSNARTGEYKFYPVIGAEEHSAMAAAEGEVQEKGYIASFPALISVNGKATYIMVLKDAGGLVKLYALVNVEKYSIVATGETQQKAMEQYTALLIEDGILGSEAAKPDESALTADITVTSVREVTVGGESYIYISADYEGSYCLFKMAVSADEAVLLIREGDTLTVTASKTDTERIYLLTAWSFKASE